MPRERQRDYLYKRPGSDHWWLRLQFPKDVHPDLAGKNHRKSLGTPNRDEAEVIAAPDIAAHKLFLMLNRQKREGSLTTQEGGLLRPVGMGSDLNGVRYFATPETVQWVDEKGQVFRDYAQQGNAPQAPSK